MDASFPDRPTLQMRNDALAFVAGALSAAGLTVAILSSEPQTALASEPEVAVVATMEESRGDDAGFAGAPDLTPDATPAGIPDVGPMPEPTTADSPERDVDAPSEFDWGNCVATLVDLFDAFVSLSDLA